MKYVKKPDGTLISSECDTVKVTENTLKKLLDTTKSTVNFFLNYAGTNIDGLIRFSDTENVITMRNMFYYSTNLITPTLFDTSKVTNMYSMFGSCINLKSIPQYNTSNVTDMNGIFSNCRSLSSVPLLNMSKVADLTNAFNDCRVLTLIPEFNVINCTNFKNTFYNCIKLKSVLMKNIMASLDLSASTHFERANLVTVLNNLGTPTTTQTLTIGSTNLAKLTEEDIAIATQKNWTLK